MKFLARVGPEEVEWQARYIFCSARVLQGKLFDSARELASAYHIGKAEAAAAMALLKEINEHVASELTRMVKRFG